MLTTVNNRFLALDCVSGSNSNILPPEPKTDARENRLTTSERRTLSDKSKKNIKGASTGSSTYKNSKPLTKHKHLKIISVNVNGMVSKKLYIELLIHDSKPDIICFQETRLDSNIHSSELVDPDKFTLFRKDRNRNGGGVCLAVSNDLLTSFPLPRLGH